MFKLTVVVLEEVVWINEGKHNVGISVNFMVMTEEVMEVGAAATAIIPMEEPSLCKLVRVKAIKSNYVRQ